MPKLIPIPIGTKFNRLTLIKELPRRNERRMGLFLCECGKTTAGAIHDVRYGHKNSCGCYCARRTRETSTIHGETINRSKSAEYSAWCSMRDRCYRERNAEYHNYGGRGIRVCQRWLNSFSDFLEDVGRRPSPRHSIDRIDVNGDYEPSNVRWATDSQQVRNQRKQPRITINETTKLICEWSEISGISPKLISRRLKKNWPAEKAVFYPLIESKRNHRHQLTRGLNA